MSNMLEGFVKKELDIQVKERYPHIQYPSGMYAKVTQVNRPGVYTIKILDKSMNINNDFPEIPQVRSDIVLAKGDVAVVMLLYDGSSVYILGRWSEP